MYKLGLYSWICQSGTVRQLGPPVIQVWGKVPGSTAGGVWAKAAAASRSGRSLIVIEDSKKKGQENESPAPSVSGRELELIAGGKLHDAGGCASRGGSDFAESG